jgi:glutamate-5-semialdehyde dehydrogenase
LSMKYSKEIGKMITTMAKEARQAARLLVRSTAEERNAALVAMANELLDQKELIVQANSIDLETAKKNGISGAMLNRLDLGKNGIEKISAAVREISEQPDPLNSIEDKQVRPNGLEVGRMRIPLGVIAMIYESRPNVTSDAAALCLRAGNAVILRGGSEAFHSNQAIAEALRNGLSKTSLPRSAIQLITTPNRDAVDALLEQDEWIDLVIPRGGESLIRAVTEKSRIPVIQHYKGVCHIFVDKSASQEKVPGIVSNAKVQRPGVCNALETLLVHSDIADAILPKVGARLTDEGVTIRGCSETMKMLEGFDITLATEEDWHAEYLDLTLAIRVVPSLESALDHIADYGSSHTEAIITEDETSAANFISAVQSSTVLVNASTRFADGGELGLGAEIGISTSKLHAFGPMGAKDLTTRKFVVHGKNHIRK